MRTVVGTLVSALSLLPTIAAGQMVNSFHFIPVVTKAQGLNNTFWQSDLYITNLGASTVQVGVKYFPSDVANTFNGTFPKTVSIAPSKNFYVADIVGTWFSSYGEGKGYLIVADITPVNCAVSSPPTSYPGQLAVTSRTYNTGDPRGTFGLTGESSLAGLNWTTFPSVLTGVHHTGTTAPGFRTNLSVANLSTQRIRVIIRAIKAGGEWAGAESIQDIEALSFKQWSLTNLGFPNLNNTPGRVEVRLDPSQVADPCANVSDSFCTNPCDPQKCPTKYALRSQPTFFAYASMTDNGTGDGTILMPVIDWQGYNKWVSAYEDQHCPSLRIYKNNTLTDWLRSQGLVGPEPPPTFRKVDR